MKQGLKLMNLIKLLSLSHKKAFQQNFNYKTLFKNSIRNMFFSFGI